MTEIRPPDGDWSGVAAFFTALGALVTSLLRGPRKTDMYGVRTKAQEAIARVAAVEGKLDGISGRLTAIETGQRELTARIDRVLERL